MKTLLKLLVSKLTNLFKIIGNSYLFQDFVFFVTSVFIVHLVGLGLISFVSMKSSFVTGLDVVGMSEFQRALVAFFYFILPLGIAGWRALKRIKNHKLESDSIDTQDEK